jgi:hypothetical protein
MDTFRTFRSTHVTMSPYECFSTSAETTRNEVTIVQTRTIQTRTIQTKSERTYEDIVECNDTWTSIVSERT